MVDADFTRFEARTPDGRGLSCLGGGVGEDVVVFEAGLGMGAAYWLPVMRLLADSHVVIAYDRAGYGESDPDTAPRTLDRLAGDLRAVVDARPGRSLVLVGHSWGGPIIRTAAPGIAESRDLAGLVLVDPSDEYLADEYRPWTLALSDLPLRALARLGLGPKLVRPLLAGMPDADADAVVRDVGTAAAARARSAEMRQFLPGLRGQFPPLPDVPIRMITGTRSDRGESAALRRRIVAAHTRSAGELGAELIEATQSGHRVPITEPGLIADVVRGLAV